MKKALNIFLAPMILFWCSPMAFALTYDFTSMDAFGALDGQTQSIFTAGGVPLNIQAGLTNASGDFILGDEAAALAVSTFADAGSHAGLGVTSTTTNSQVNADTLIAGKYEAIVFNFNPLFVPKEISLTSFFGESEDIRIFTDGVLFGDFYGGDMPSGLKSISFGGTTFSSLQITTLGPDSPLSTTDDSDYRVASISGTVVPEPSTILLIGTGLVGFAGTRLRKKFKK